MSTRRIGICHPGDMGAGLGAALADHGHSVFWASEGRSRQSAERAERAGMTDVGSIGELEERCDLIVSVCPPSAALDVAGSLRSYTGLYLDANAISPASARAVATTVETIGARYVDGGIVGGPPTADRHARLFLSGPHASELQETFAGSWVDTQVVSPDSTAASALKMCFAAWSKGTAALLLDIRARARAEGIESSLLELWRGLSMDLEDRSIKAGLDASTKGWRWVGEMDEIASTFRSARLPDGFHRAAAEIYERPSRDEAAVAGLETLRSVLEQILNEQ